MDARVSTMDRLVADRRVAQDWTHALRAVHPHIDDDIEACLTKLSTCPSYLPKDEGRIWRAYEQPLAALRVLILGQDPYPNEKHAVGLAFSTGPKGPIPSSLQNIYDELEDSGYQRPGHGNLSAWTERGVMLLNRAMTVPVDPEAGPRVHFRWWKPIITATMQAIAVEADKRMSTQGGRKRRIAALLWGVQAQRMKVHLGDHVHVITSSHPSPQSAHRRAGGQRTFQGSRPFAHVNRYFEEHRADRIDWTLDA